MIDQRQNFTTYELELLVEALATRAARLESEARYRPQTAGPIERRAAAMRKLRAKLITRKVRP